MHTTDWVLGMQLFSVDLLLSWSFIIYSFDMVFIILIVKYKQQLAAYDTSFIFN